MVKQVEFRGEQIILAPNGALVASKTEANSWHCIRPLGTMLTCDCKGFVNRGRCRHVEAVKTLISEIERKAEAATPTSAAPASVPAPVQKPYDSSTAPLAGPAIDPELFPPSRPHNPKRNLTFEQLFPEYIA